MKCPMISVKARPARNPPSAWLRLDWFVGADNAHALQRRALFQEYEVQLGGTREIIRCKRLSASATVGSEDSLASSVHRAASSLWSFEVNMALWFHGCGNIESACLIAATTQ